VLLLGGIPVSLVTPQWHYGNARFRAKSVPRTGRRHSQGTQGPQGQSFRAEHDAERSSALSRPTLRTWNLYGTEFDSELKRNVRFVIAETRDLPEDRLYSKEHRFIEEIKKELPIGSRPL